MADPSKNIFPDISFQAQPIKEFFLARQPILSRDQNLFAYELLFRSAAAGPANVTNDLSATASVIAHASELGLENVIGTSLGFINVNAEVLMSDFIRFLPRHKVVLEILETVEVTDRLMERVAYLKEDGYMFALDDVIADSQHVRQLLPFVEIIKVDLNGMRQRDLVRLARQFKSAGKRLLAEKVETLKQFQTCIDLGFDYFQGYYFALPMVLAGKKLSPSQLAVMRLIAQIASGANTSEIERSIKQDASLGLTLLRLVNALVRSSEQHVDSIGQALAVLGRHQLQHWLHILLYADLGKPSETTSPLLALAATRGKLLELIAEKVRPGDRNMADIAFTIGIMSLMDALFGLPMEDILQRLSVADEVKDALLSRQGLYGDMLKLVEYLEHIKESGPLLAPLLEKLQLSIEELNALQLVAFEWSDAIAQNT